MYYKLKVDKDKIEIVDYVEDKKDNDNEFLYATEDEIRLLNPKAISSDGAILDSTLFNTP